MAEAFNTSIELYGEEAVKFLEFVATAEKPVYSPEEQEEMNKIAKQIGLPPVFP